MRVKAFFPSLLAIFFSNVQKYGTGEMIFFEQIEYKHMAEISYKMCFLFQMSVLEFVVAYVVKVDFSVGKSYKNTIKPNKSVNPFSFEEESLSFI